MLFGVHLYFYLLVILLNISLNFLHAFCRDMQRGPLLIGKHVLRVTYYIVPVILIASFILMKWYIPLLIIATFILSMPISFLINKILYSYFRLTNAVWFIILLDIISVALIFMYIFIVY